MDSATQFLALAFVILPLGIASASVLKNRVQYWLAIHIALQVSLSFLYLLVCAFITCFVF